VIATADMRALSCAVLGALCLTAVASAGTELDRVLATVDGEPITSRQFDVYAADVGHPDVSHDQLLQTLITEKLLDKEATARKITVSDDDVAAYITEIRTQNGLDEAAFATALEQQGYTMESYHARIKDELLKTQLVNQAIRARVNVPREDVERYYDAHKEDYRTGGGRTVQNIFLPIPDDASDADVAALEAKARELAAAGTSHRKFAELARQYSKGAGADQDGVLGTFKPGQLQDEFDHVVFALPVGGVSEPIRSGGGFYVLRVDAEVDAGTRPLKDVEDQIRDKLYKKALEDRYQEWLAHDLRESHDVEVLN
jgi:peptidyl-prolyl cis-trans isomerase SurA